MLVQLPFETYGQYHGHAGNGQSALLQAVRNSIAKTYSTTSIRGDGQVIVIHFTDGITFEIVPAFLSQNGSYTYPDTNAGGRWHTTNPRAEIDAMRARNTSCNGNLVGLSRMMRAWKEKWNVPISGLLIDTLAYQFIEGFEYRKKSYFYYDYMCRDFFQWMAAQDDDQEYGKAPGSRQYVYGKGLFQYKAKRCHNLALQAIAYETHQPKQEWSAKQRWREIYRNRIPGLKTRRSPVAFSKASCERATAVSCTRTRPRKSAPIYF